MPYPVALAVAAAATAAGTGMQMAGAAKSQRAMNDAQTAEMLRQRGYQRESTEAFNRNLDKSTRATADAEAQDGTVRRENAYRAIETNAAQPGSLVSERAGNTAATSAAARSNAATRATTNAWTQLVGAARAKLGGSEDWGLNQNIRNNRAGQDIGIASSKARGSASVLPVEMDAASHRGDGLKGWGQLVSALGSVAGMYGATAAASPAISSAGTAAHAANTGTQTINYTPQMANSWAALA